MTAPILEKNALYHHHIFFRRMRIIAGSQVVEDFDSYNRVHHMFSKLMSQGARRDEANKVSVIDTMTNF